MQHALQKDQPALLLAPMEGVTDSPMRALLSEMGGFSHMVTEFFRVNQLVPPAKILVRHMAELKTKSCTASGTPVFLQLLGGNPERLAETAALGAKLGAAGIDLNFGCPAPTVNRHDGGATLLLYPERILTIVKAVRAAVPSPIPVSVKMRLGFDDPTSIYKNADMALQGGASWITVHGRTKSQGYKPPAYWEAIGDLVKSFPIPIVANGEIWTIDDFRRCRDVTNAKHYMIGRGALANPLLVQQIAEELGLPHQPTEENWLGWMDRFAALALPLSTNPNYVVKRLKQWLRYADQRGNFQGFQELKRAENLDAFMHTLHGSGVVNLREV